MSALVALNIVLFIALLVVSWSPQAAAADARRRPGDYMMIAGESPTREQQAIVYIVELKSSKIVATIFNSNNNSFTVLDGRVINDDLGQTEER